MTLIEHFIEHGWARLPAAVPPERTEAVRRRVAERVCPLPEPARPPDRFPSTTRLMPEHDPQGPSRHLSVVAPAAWELSCALVGGEGELADPRLATLDAGFVLNFPVTTPWKPPTPDGFGWHLDGFDGRRFLASPAIALVLYVLWSDVGPRGGGTFLAPGALGAMARFLAARPDGVEDHLVPHADLLRESNPDYLELTGEAGTVYVTHPLVIHAASFNVSDSVRVLSVSTIAVKRGPSPVPDAARPLDAALRRALAA